MTLAASAIRRGDAFAAPTIRDLLTERGLAPRRDLGQNFVADPNTVRRIAHLARVGPGDRVVEVGAGLGSLTLALAETGAAVIAVEVDRGLAAVLREVVAGHAAVTVVEADAMTLDWAQLLGADGRSVLVANLPYNVATPLVADLLDGVPKISRMLVMVQREVGERLAAGPGTAAYGAVSVKVAYWGTARIVGHVPASVFMPRPKVESALVEITRHEPPDTAPGELFELVRTASGSAARCSAGRSPAWSTPTQFAAAGIAETARPEELGVDDWVPADQASSRPGVTE